MEQDVNGKVQKINEEDYEIIKKIEELGPLFAEKWYQEEYDCSSKDARMVVKEIRKKYNIHPVGSYWPTDKEVVTMLEDNRDDIGYVEKWVMEEAGCSSTKAVEFLWGKDRSEYFSNNGNNESNEGNGCIITILIAITATLSSCCFFF